MYESFFGLSSRPFAAVPSAKRYFPAAFVETARQTLARCIDRAEGFGVLVGPAGTGKTLLCQLLTEQFRGRFSVAHLSSGWLSSPRILLQSILFELGLPYRGLEEGELRLSLADQLTNRDPQSAGLVLLIDEAHTLSLRLLDEVRLLTNLVRHGQPRVRVMIAGSPQLEERLASPKLESFNQRIAARCFVQPFSYDETLGFIRAELAAAGGDADRIFTSDAMLSVHQATDGVARLINQVCDHALLLACAGGVEQIGQAGIDEAWADLQQLPAPWVATTVAAGPAPDIIEFGGLDDEPRAVALSVADDSSPRLRAIADEMDERDLDLFAGEPDERLEKIEARLEMLDQPFEPAGTIGAEIEAVFPVADDPFQEAFAEEEVVIDRFSSMDADVLANRPVVQSAEGRALSALLAPYTQSKTATAPPPRSPSNRAPLLPESEESNADFFEFSAMPPAAVAETDEPAATLRMPLRAADDPVFPEEPMLSDNPVLSEVPMPVAAPVESPAPVASTITAEQLDRADDDLIIVEDDPVPSPGPEPAAPEVRRQEYRHLFAKLRRG